MLVAFTIILLFYSMIVTVSNCNYTIFRRGNGQQGFVPANYVKEIEPAVVTQKVKKTVIEEVPVVKKIKEKVKRRAKPIQRKKGTRTFSCA